MDEGIERVFAIEVAIDKAIQKGSSKQDVVEALLALIVKGILEGSDDPKGHVAHIAGCLVHTVEEMIDEDRGARPLQ